MFKWLKLSHHVHSGHLRPHEYTSYLPLAIILVLVGVSLTVYTSYAASPGPEAGSIGLTGIMPGAAPTVAATINTPVDQQHFRETPIVITGTCPANTLVEVFKTNIFAGSTTCTDDGTYSLQTDLLSGTNALVAKVYDALNQAGPDSNIVTVYYDAMPTQGAGIKSLDFGGAQLLLNTDAVFRGIFPNQELNIPIDILGGTPPYAINVQWGDSTNKVISRNDNVTFSATHTYTQAGTYQVSVQASDANGRLAYLTVATIVNGQASSTGSTSSSLTSEETNKLLVLWPVYTGLIAVVVSFWVGEQREKRVLRMRGILVP